VETMSYEEWLEEFNVELKEDFIDDELRTKAINIIHEHFEDEVCDEIFQDEFREYCEERFDTWVNDQKERCLR
jgi:hypothetical protein